MEYHPEFTPSSVDHCHWDEQPCLLAIAEFVHFISECKLMITLDGGHSCYDQIGRSRIMDMLAQPSFGDYDDLIIDQIDWCMKKRDAIIEDRGLE